MLRKSIKFGVLLATIGGPLIVLFGFLNWFHPAFDLIANFRYHAALGCIFLALVWMVAKHWRIGVSVLLVGAFALFSASAGLPKLKSAPAISDSKIYSIISFNVRFDNPNRNDLIKLLEKHDPDIFIGIEMSSIWSDQLFRLSAIYKNTFHCPEWANIGGIYVFSKFSFTDANTYCHDYAAFGTQQMLVDGQAITIAGTHLRWPWPASQPRQLRALKPVLKKLDENALVVGDFNASTWTYAISSFADNGRLKVVPNIGLTWLDVRLPKFLTRWLGLPIDNVMHKGRVKVIDVKALPHTGSDHLPILTRFSVLK